MKIRQVMLSEITNNPHLSLSPKDYIKPEKIIVCVAPKNWGVVLDCHKLDCEYCNEIKENTQKIEFLSHLDASKFIRNLSLRIEITEDQYNYIKLKG
jgi:hypothetical protein